MCPLQSTRALGTDDNNALISRDLRNPAIELSKGDVMYPRNSPFCDLVRFTNIKQKEGWIAVKKWN